MNSNFVEFPDSPFEAVVFSLRYSDITSFVERSVLSFALFVELCAIVRAALAPLRGDNGFQNLLKAFDAILDTSIREELRVALGAGANRRMALCRLDQRIRVGLRERLVLLVTAIHQLDAYCSLATTAQLYGFSFPTIADGTTGALSVSGLHHPLLRNAVANDVSAVGERVMFLTGPNMAGKSTVLRALGIVVVFAHLGLAVPAVSATVPLTDRLVASLGNEDNILRGESLYLAEVRRVKSVIAAVADGESVVALLDEVFRGTNVKDAADATALLVNGLSRAKRGLFVVSSHLVEVAQDCGNTPGVSLWCMQVSLELNDFKFIYVLERGVSDVRLGMALLRSEGVVSLLERVGNPRAPAGHEG